MLPLSLLPLLPLLSTASITLAKFSHAEERELLRSGPFQIGLYQALTDADVEAGRKAGEMILDGQEE
jgi:hypothetical protein